MNSLTRAKRHRISLTAPRQPRKPISMVRAPTPMRMYAPFFREGDEVSVRARTGKKKLTTDKYNTCHHLENCFYIHISLSSSTKMLHGGLLDIQTEGSFCVSFVEERLSESTCKSPLPYILEDSG